MACFLTIETSTKICSVALAVEQVPVFERINERNESHASSLGIFVYEAIKYADENKLTIEAIAVGAGPGSYTGLRIGISEAKGLCYGFEIPLIAIPTLKIMASSCLLSGGAPLGEKENIQEVLLCPMLDARRMEVYAALYDMNLHEVRSAQAEIVDENSFKEYLDKQPILFFGEGANKYKSLINSPNALFVNDIYPVASAMIPLAEEAFAQKIFVDVAYFEPFYLKEFQATVAKNKVIQQLLEKK
jgi:tRNA threonylcarbamoyladenosine biosynthesis protein TsaB